MFHADENVHFDRCRKNMTDLKESIFQRIGFTKRRATTAKQPVSPGFLKEISFSFPWAIKEVLDAYDGSDNLVININQTSLQFILLSKYTMDKKNKKLVPIANSADYRQVTETFSITLSGFFTHANNLLRSDWPPLS